MKFYCANCGTLIDKPPSYIARTRFCSGSCKRDFNNRFYSFFRKCVQCGMYFLPRNLTQKYCSSVCATLAHQAKLRLEKERAMKAPKEKTEEPKEDNVETWAREAADCGLSYGQYKAQRFTFGKSYEELKDAFEKRRGLNDE